MKHSLPITPITAWQSVALLETGATIFVREHSSNDNKRHSEKPFSPFDLSMIECREAISRAELYGAYMLCNIRFIFALLL